MFGPLGLPELIFILVLALLIFGPKKLPEIGRTLGRGLGEFRRASEDLKRTFNAELALDEEEGKGAARRPPALRPAAGAAPRPGSRPGAPPPSPSPAPGAPDPPPPASSEPPEPAAPAPEGRADTREANAAPDEAEDADQPGR